MARFIKTVTASGESIGGGAGVTLDQVCTAVCTVISANAQNKETAVAGGVYTAATPDIIPGYNGCWKMICNCPQWTDCYGCCLIWNIDTERYRGFRIQYRGIRSCACCYMYFCPGFGTETCFCCCDEAYRGMCTCGWPQRSCVQWNTYNKCYMITSACIYCCSRPVDIGWGFDFCIWMPAWKDPGRTQSGNIFYKWVYKKNIAGEANSYCYPGCDVHWGMAFCPNMGWSVNQVGYTGFLSRMCLKVHDVPFQPTTVGGNYCSTTGGNMLAGQPCWSIYGIPCHRPHFGTVDGTFA